VRIVSAAAPLGLAKAMWADPAPSRKTCGWFPPGCSTTGGGGLAGTKFFGIRVGLYPGDVYVGLSLASDAGLATVSTASAATIALPTSPPETQSRPNSPSTIHQLTKPSRLTTTSRPARGPLSPLADQKR
jgi:hypothetical protein